MATRLGKTIKRELELGGKLYTVSGSPGGVRIVPKGGRKGHEMSSAALVSGEAELRRAHQTEPLPDLDRSSPGGYAAGREL